MLKVSLRLFLLGVAGAASSSCGSNQDASEANFTSAINDSLANVFCRKLRESELRLAPEKSDEPAPFPIILRANNSYGLSGLPGQREYLEARASEGLLKRESRVAPAAALFAEEPLKPTEMIVYTPTEKGRSIFRGIPGKTAGGDWRPMPAACMGEGKVTKITNFTQPADMLGRKVTDVSYEYRAEGIPEVVPSDQKAELLQPRTGKATLVLTEKGWVDAGDLER